MAKKERCYNMLCHATLLHIKSLRPNPVLGLNTASKKTSVCMHACIVAPHCEVCKFLQNEETSKFVSNHEQDLKKYVPKALKGT